MLLADSAQVADGKLYILGGGWSVTGPDPTPSAVAMKVMVDWHEFNTSHHWELFLEDADGQPVRFDTPDGPQPIEVRGDFSAAAPDGAPDGARQRRRVSRRGLRENGHVSSYDRPFGRYFEEFEVGDVYKHWPGKTITEADDHLFCMITMNHHPLHTNAWFAEHETVHHKNVVVGNLVYSLVLGMSVPDVSGSAIANLEVESLVHRHPTFHGDTIYAETRVLDKVASTSRQDRGVVTVETKAFNQRGEEVCYFRRKLMVWTQAS